VSQDGAKESLVQEIVTITGIQLFVMLILVVSGKQVGVMIEAVGITMIKQTVQTLHFTQEPTVRGILNQVAEAGVKIKDAGTSGIRVLVKAILLV